MSVLRHHKPKLHHFNYYFKSFSSRFDYNYSGFGLMDWIFGTDKAYRNSVYEKRDRLLLSSKSAHELYPAEKNESNKKIQ